MSVPTTNQHGLSHLMEAATALTKLTGGVPKSANPGPVVGGLRQASAKFLLQPAPSSHPSIATLTPATHEGGKPKIFPEHLMDILNDRSLSDTVTWLPHGRSFVIIRPDVFTEQVLPKYLPPVDARSSTKYPSFTRKLNRWGFRQATRGPDTGAFQHPFFRRDQPDLCLQMVCQRTSANSDKKKRISGASSVTQSNKSRLPAKKRHVLLTKESLEAMTEEQEKKKVTTTTIPEPTRTAFQPATVSEDSLSNASDRPSNNNSTATVSFMGRTITNDTALAQKALAICNEEERMRVARVMLYDSYQRALRGER